MDKGERKLRGKGERGKGRKRELRGEGERGMEGVNGKKGGVRGV